MSPLLVVELSSLLILGAFLVVLARARPRPLRDSLREIGLLAGAAWIAEVSCIRLYAFYQYDAPWTLFLDVMPLLVAFIWPFVIISARELAIALGFVDARGAPRVLAVFAIVLYDASLVEPIAVRAGLWSWNEPGLFGVPLIGVLGWAFFAALASALLDRLPRRATPLLLIAAPVATHLLLLAAWWGALRWILRGEIAPSAAAIASASISALLAFIVLRRGRRADFTVMGPRIGAAILFFALLTWRGSDILPLVAYGAAFAVPYLLATDWRSVAATAGVLRRA